MTLFWTVFFPFDPSKIFALDESVIALFILLFHSCFSVSAFTWFQIPTFTLKVTLCVWSYNVRKSIKKEIWDYFMDKKKNVVPPAHTASGIAVYVSPMKPHQYWEADWVIRELVRLAVNRGCHGIWEAIPQHKDAPLILLWAPLHINYIHMVYTNKAHMYEHHNNVHYSLSCVWSRVNYVSKF